MKKVFLLNFLFLILGLPSNAQTFEVSYDSNLIQGDFSGNILLYLSKENKSPRNLFVGLELNPVFRVAVEKLSKDGYVTFNDDAISYPVELSNIERGEYYAQVVFDLNIGDANIGSSTGNIYSEPIKVNINKEFDKVFKIQANKVIAPINFNGNEYLKELRVKSDLLSTFHQKDIYVNAAVSLPKEYYSQPNKEYPVIFSTFGFGGNYKLHSGHDVFLDQLEDQPTIVVYLDGQCPEGHSTYANSDINGPWGDALVKEFIPALQDKYRTNGAILLYGHSSGGWTSLWLQINYPTTFIGAWSSAPDQVDFRNYQNVNIYEAENIFYNDIGFQRPLFTIAGRIPVVYAKDFYRTEHVLYRGSQVHSFDAVFGSYDENKNRIRLVNIPSGEINKNALPYWKRYDISIKLRENWADLKEDLDGKIRISVGTGDNIYLNRSVELLEKEMNLLNANMQFEYFAGDHFTIFNEEYITKGTDFLVQCYKTWLNDNK